MRFVKENSTHAGVVSSGILREILNDFARNLEYLQESLNKQAVSGSSIFKNVESLHCLEASVPLVLFT